MASSDIEQLVTPLIKPEFKEVIEISHRLVRSDISSMGDLKEIIVKLSGYLMFCGTMAGYYSAERRRKEAEGVMATTGTQEDKKSAGRISSGEERKFEEIFNNMFLSLKNQVDALKACLKLKIAEMERTK